LNGARPSQIAVYERDILPAVEATLARASESSHAADTSAGTAPADSSIPLLTIDFATALSKELDVATVVDGYYLYDLVTDYVDNPNAISPDTLAKLQEEAELRKARGLADEFLKQFDPATNSPEEIATNLGSHLYSALSPERCPLLQELLDNLQRGDGHLQWESAERFNRLCSNGDGVEVLRARWGIDKTLSGLQGTVGRVVDRLAARSVAETKRSEYDSAFSDVCAAYDILACLDTIKEEETQCRRLEGARLVTKALCRRMEKESLSDSQVRVIRTYLEHASSSALLTESILMDGARLERAGLALKGSRWQAKSYGQRSPFLVAKEQAALLLKDPALALRQAQETAQYLDAIENTREAKVDFAEDFLPVMGVVLTLAPRAILSQSDQSDAKDDDVVDDELFTKARTATLKPRTETALILSGQEWTLLEFARFRLTRDAFEVALLLDAWRREHGSYPSSLDALIPDRLAQVPKDVLFSQPLVYEVTADGYAMRLPGSLTRELHIRDESSGIVWQTRATQRK